MSGEHRDVPVPHRDAPPGTCQWCGVAIVYGRRKVRRWHDGREDEPRCLHEYRMVSSADYVRLVAKREGWLYCVECGRQGPGLAGPFETVVYDSGYVLVSDHSQSAAVWRAIRHRIPGLVWWDMFPHLDVPAATPHWSFTLEVDHIVPLIDGGPHAVSNLALLCPDHHKAKTAREARQRAQRRRLVGGQLALGIG